LFLPFQNPNVLPFSLTCADFGVVSLKSGAESLSVPSKLYYQLAAGNAIIGITEENSELALIINKYKCGKVTSPGDAEGLIQYLLNLNQDAIQKYKDQARIASNDFTNLNAYKFVSRPTSSKQHH